MPCRVVGCRRWNITHFIEVLLARCAKESDQETRTLLASCLGEVGAINSNCFDDIQTHFGSHARHTTDPPWHSAPHRFQLQLVTTYLVAALKAAPETNDQHKIAFAIQQLLALLNDAGEEGLLSTSYGDSPRQGCPPKSKISTLPNDDTLQKPKMNESLICRLTEAQVLDVVEPFWVSDFHEVSPRCIFEKNCSLALTVSTLVPTSSQLDCKRSSQNSSVFSALVDFL
jgi:hypothetical protein